MLLFVGFNQRDQHFTLIGLFRACGCLEDQLQLFERGSQIIVAADGLNCH